MHPPRVPRPRLQIGLVHAIGLDLGTTLLVTGLYNIASGVQFDIPMCVQPMKTIAAVAIAGAPALSIPQMAAAGGFVSACVVLLGGSGLVDLLDWLVPRCTVRGVQVAVGLKLAIKVSRAGHVNASMHACTASGMTAHTHVCTWTLVALA